MWQLMIVFCCKAFWGRSVLTYPVRDHVNHWLSQIVRAAQVCDLLLLSGEGEVLQHVVGAQNVRHIIPKSVAGIC